MRKRDELSDQRSCLNKGRDDEWLFVLLGRDAAAPAAVTAWIDARLRLGLNADNDPQIAEAREWVAKAWADLTEVKTNARTRTKVEGNS